jgi:hypothetical protein
MLLRLAVALLDLLGRAFLGLPDKFFGLLA